MKNHLFVIIAVLIILVIAGLVIRLQTERLTAKHNLAFRQTKIPALTIIPAYKLGILSLSIRPPTTNFRLSAFAVRIKIETEPKLPLSAAKAVTPGADFISSQWFFPFNRTAAVSPTELEIKIAGYYVSKNQFVISPEATLFTLLIPDIESIKITIDSKDTKFYGDSPIPYRLNGVEDTVTLIGD